MGESSTPNRWLIALAGTAMQLCLGTVYAWSYFQEPLVRIYSWSNTQVTWAFSLTICCLGLAAAWGGTQLPRFGPRRLAVAGGILFGSGYLLAALALLWRSLPLLYLGYGVVGGFGLGLGYVTPVATVAKWFPDKKGLVTGMVIMGFGFGALLMSKLFAPFLVERSGGNLVVVFACLGVGFMVVTVAVALVLRNPPAGSAIGTAGNSLHCAATITDAGTPALSRHAPADVLSLRFGILWGVFFCNILTGISIISFQSPLLQSLWRDIDPDLSPQRLCDHGATLIAVSSLFNGAGRMFWGGLSDHIGRARTFRFMLVSQVAVFILLPWVGSPWLFSGLICYVLFCYGGGFGTMPSFVLDAFGARRMAVVYGFILTAWSAAGIAGPQLVAFLKDHYAQQLSTYAFLVNAGVLSIGLALSLLLREHGAEPK